MTGRLLCELLESIGYTPRSYSGRGIYGAQCVGVNVEPNEMLTVPAELARDVRHAADYMHDDEALDAVVVLMSGARWDEMGRGLILYWPGVAWPSVETEIEEEAADAKP